ncbi:MAG: exodeoxyribonuclease V subunit beta, partial [Methylomonas sp.]
HAWSAGGSLHDDKLDDNNLTDDNLTDDNLVKFARTRLQAALNKKHQHQAAVFDHPALMALDDYAALLERKPNIASPLRLHALHWMRQRYDTEKRRLSTLSFDDMLTRLDRALASTGGDKLATAIRLQYPVALIDEFQDTDPLQYRIFATLYPADVDSDSRLTCLMIGDPKQAIYSFRGGDIHSYLRAYRATVGKHYTLNVNYRSTKGLVVAVNRVFAHADASNPQGAFGFAAGQNDPLPFHPVAAQGRKARWIVDGQPATPLTLWHWHSEDAVASPVYRKHMAEVCASDIVRLLNQAEQGVCGFAADDGRFQALKASDIAVLVRSGREARAIRLALYRRGLKSVYLSERDSIYATPQAQDLVFWLSAMAEPRNERAVRAALATTTLALDYPTLLALADDEDCWEWHLEAFQRYQASWRNDGILPALRQMIADYQLHGRLMAAADGERCLTNLLHLAELLQHASGQLDGEQALIRHLSDAIQTAQNGRSSNDGILRLESDAQLIKVVTIHKAKGLEYPLVFLPFICSYREAGSQNGIYRYHNDDLAVCIALPPNDDLKTIKAISERERMQEDLRLLYVALTRGQYACWLGIAPIKVLGKQCQLAKSAIGHVLDWQPGTAASQLADKLQALQGDCSAIAIVPLPQPTADSHQPLTPPPVLQVPRQAVRHIADDWWIASYSALNIDSERLPAAQPEQAADTPQDDKRRDEADPDTPLAATDGIHALPRGAAAGVLIHELLEHCARRGFAKVAADTALQVQLIAPILQITPWQRHEPALTSALQAWLDMNLLGDAAVRLVDLDNGYNHYQAEMEFLIGINPVDLQTLDALIARHVFPGRPRPHLQPGQLHGLLKGFIDLVFVHDERYYVLDYKFNMLGSSDAAYTHEALIDALLERRYDLQAALYLLALHRLLQTRLGDGYDIGRHLGGAVYLFLRGVHAANQGRLLMPANIELVLAMDALFLAEATA